MGKKQEGMGHETSFEYPTGEQFQEALPVFLQKVRGEDVPANDLIHAAYTVGGYALGAMYPHGPMHASDSGLAASDDMQELVAAAESGKAGKGMKGWADIPWKSILALAMRVLQELVVQAS